VTVLNQTPSAFRQLIQAEREHSSGLPLALRTVVFGGEALETAMLRPWFERHGDRIPQLVNMYGITETTVHVTYRLLTVADSLGTSSPIGVPIPDLHLDIFDTHFEPVPAMVPGELYIGGAGLAQGYFRRQALTRDRFIDDPHGRGGRLYRTGDRVRRRPDGEIEYLGRFDDQVKIRGFRVESGEVAVALSRHGGVADAAVTLYEHDGNPLLVAYYVPREGALKAADLRRHLQDLAVALAADGEWQARSPCASRPRRPNQSRTAAAVARAHLDRAAGAGVLAVSARQRSAGRGRQCLRPRRTFGTGRAGPPHAAIAVKARYPSRAVIPTPDTYGTRGSAAG
jgi:acyl-coenzyme A synthetase/AMP-(fatty) acid ligase